MAPPTILSRKSDFLAAQTRLLSQPLSPSRSWRDDNRAADDGIPERAVDDVLFRLNHALQQHARRAYAPQATRHVAEQIDQLFWDAGRVPEAGREGADGLSVGLDFADSEAISALPATWEPEREAEANPIEAKRYSELAERLQTLDAQRSAAQERVLRLRLVDDLLEPFFRQGSGTVQDSLITRDCEVEREMERMRTLLARVGARLGHVLEQEGTGPGRNDDDAEDVEVDEKRKVDNLFLRF